MIFFTQGFLFSRTEFRIKKKQKNCFKVTVFFLRGHGRWSLIHSYQKTVFPRSGKKKKNVFFFISRGKVHRSFNQILIKFLFLYKSLFRFFTAFLCVVFFFFLFHGNVQRSFIHSIFGQESTYAFFVNRKFVSLDAQQDQSFLKQ